MRRPSRCSPPRRTWASGHRSRAASRGARRPPRHCGRPACTGGCSRPAPSTRESCWPDGTSTTGTRPRSGCATRTRSSTTAGGSPLGWTSCCAMGTLPWCWAGTAACSSGSVWRWLGAARTASCTSTVTPTSAIRATATAARAWPARTWPPRSDVTGPRSPTSTAWVPTSPRRTSYTSAAATTTSTSTRPLDLLGAVLPASRVLDVWSRGGGSARRSPSSARTTCPATGCTWTSTSWTPSTCRPWTAPTRAAPRPRS